MTRRRLILAIVVAVLCAVAWWLSLDRLSAEERLLVAKLTRAPAE
jgi:protein-S-isoprenylcysteine O-methyltransferase Ste14